MARLAALESELAAREDDLNTCKEMLALEPNSTDALETIPMLEADIANIKSKIAALKASAPPQSPTENDKPKWDPSKHPKFASTNNESDTPPPPPPEDFQVKDTVLAKYSEDKQFYPAVIVSKTGSSSDPVFKVTFKGYNNTETKRKHEIRAVPPEPASKKRKASPPPPPPKVPPPPRTEPQTGPVISAPAAIDTNPPKKREPSKVSDGPTRLPPEPKKLKGSKVLDKQKSSWQDFQKSGPKKLASGGSGSKVMGRESQFRTANLPGAKVGFTGSGKPMQKDPSRQTWKYGQEEEEE